ncbi:stage V sporulation protein B [Clostridium saccharobutylicum]|uniref:Multidrug-efflux transporter n=1 Tax=Clostridium saccharobutylicum DSM 13864 TaxID=1345695 RepID=U5MU66_CLOSA|nr:stage V sporulation protein B [Clostridium saccharobutylicum]AGX44068.1 stage V sporulation protein B [Clostridium saccharobutylicum DSM 13864]AQR91359.1 stage V sporulation protein B [Clostridium saccharobutylicum]AQS01263.1 stage V sporulation protein B [Clostridium saccharobutylicum]AQS15246.1 stage V sporulation protein B [Clostridium saccharobutylicum]MBA2905879.1 stage V sporulation protein B [Clostridium saccharobutylicum]
MNKDKDNFFKNTFLLTASNITTGILSFIFSIYLSKILGPEGMGLYNLVMPIYNLFICLMAAGVVASISKIAAIYTQKGEYNNIAKTIKVVAIFNISWALLIGIIVFFSSSFIGTYGVNDTRTIKAIRVICPAMVCIAISNIFKGYFYGTSKIIVPAIIDILEKAMRVITVSLLIFLTQAKTLEGMVTLATVALCIGELQSLICLYIYYKYSINKIPPSTKKPESGFQLLFDVIIICIPLCVNGFLTNILGTLATLLVPRRLIIAGFSHTEALSIIGKYNGMAMTLITIPLIVVSTINTLLIPDLSQTLSEGKQYKASLRIHKVIKLAFLLGISTTIICNIIPNSLGEMFYGRNDLGPYIRFASIPAPIFFTSLTMFGILNGLNRQGIILRNSLIEALLELVCLYIFTAIPSINIFGYSITMFICCGIGLILNIHEVNKHIDISLNISNIIIYLLLGFLTFLVLNILSKHLLINTPLINNFVISALTFSLFMYLGKFGESEI